MEKISWTEFELLSEIKRLKHGVIKKSGGYSVGPYASLNLGTTVGDDHKIVEKNLELAAQAFQTSNLIWAKTSHSNLVGEADLNTMPGTISCDSLCTRQPNVALLTMFADCQVALFYDPINHVIANAHSGWRGSVGNIYKQTVQWMHDRHGSKPEDLLVCITPSLGPKHAQFIHYKKELPEEFWDFRIGECHFDFWKISQFQLEREGVLPDHIEIAKVCTYENEKEFFSYRRDKITGRNGALIMLL